VLEDTSVVYISEFFGTLVLTMTVVGSGIMAQSLTDDVAVQLLINALATVAILYILINLFSSLSGAHFNPIVTLVSFLRKERTLATSVGYLVSQTFGGFLGVLIAHLMFNRMSLEFSSRERVGANLFLAEVIATFGLVLLAFATWSDFSSHQRSIFIALWIGSAYFFTSSTSFANPAVTIARMFTDSFSGISPSSVPLFLVAQLLGGLLAWIVLRFSEVSRSGLTNER